MPLVTLTALRSYRRHRQTEGEAGMGQLWAQDVGFGRARARRKELAVGRGSYW
jgi:hypothetical protein